MGEIFKTAIIENDVEGLSPNDFLSFLGVAAVTGVTIGSLTTAGAIAVKKLIEMRQHNRFDDEIVKEVETEEDSKDE
ncbi:hypothetical protein [Turicimonas muris]|uniref:hypothetical protein n=1 Tax=Turicimonas muris TaxID=1796652 RepID=UPI002604CBA5|nr:hypothetical protein [Turicimonas muris]